MEQRVRSPGAQRLIDTYDLSVENVHTIMSISGKNYVDVVSVVRYLQLSGKVTEGAAMHMLHHTNNRAHTPATEHEELRKKAKQVGLRNSYFGSNSKHLHHALNVVETEPEKHLHIMTQKRLVEQIEASNKTLLKGVTVSMLASLFPEKKWARYKRKGWCMLRLNFSEKEARCLRLSYDVAMAELGVDPTNPSSFENAKGVQGYDFSWGWLRNPGCNLPQIYLATHPRLYRFHVGLYARLMIEHDLVDLDERVTVRACLSLQLQLYNSKLHFPKDTTKCFSHLDCDWKRGGIETPAPQCFVSTSPSHTQSGKQIFGCRFALQKPSQLRAEAKRLGSSLSPYRLPRTAASPGPWSHATACPQWVDFQNNSTSPRRLDVGHMLLFDHLSAHEFTQYAKAPSGDRAEEWVRTAEYPTLVCPALHGKPHQTNEEVLMCLLCGKPPQRWPHVYTGNKMTNAAPLFLPLFPPIPAVPLSPLGRAMLGNWETEGYSAVSWLLDALRLSKKAMKTAEKAAVAMHEQVHLDEWSGQLKQRLNKLIDAGRVAAAEGEARGRGLRSAQAACAADVIPPAARAARDRVLQFE